MTNRIWTSCIILLCVLMIVVQHCESSSAVDRMNLLEHRCNKNGQPGPIKAKCGKKQPKPGQVNDKCGKHPQTAPICNHNSSVSNVICKGINLALTECRHQFKWDLWNCLVTENAVFAKSSYIKGTREDSFLQAISAAGILFEVYKSCYTRDDQLCRCNSGSDALNWKWTGCKDYVRYGEKISNFGLGKDDVPDSLDTAIKQHNERVGHWAVKETLKRVCKCHGVTGSCTTQTCWHQLSDFRDIGNLLKRKYKRAKCFPDCKQNNANKASYKYTGISKQVLLHTREPPNYCDSDNVTYMGTIGRECTRIAEPGEHDDSLITKFERTSCKRVCKECGHKLKSVKCEETVRCDCKFQWCCSVECKHCKKKVTKYFCK